MELCRTIKSSYGVIPKENVKKAMKYVYLTGNDNVDYKIIESLENLRQLVQEGTSNDIAKYALPEAFKFKGQVSFNLRSLMHLLTLRLPKDALLEFRLLALEMLSVLPEDYKNLLRQNEQIKELETSLRMQLAGLIDNLPKIHTTETDRIN